MSDQLQKLKDIVGKKAFGITPTEARAKGICVDCKFPIVKTTYETGKPGNVYSIPGMKQYGLSAQCEYCYDKLFAGLEEEQEPEDNDAF